VYAFVNYIYIRNVPCASELRSTCSTASSVRTGPLPLSAVALALGGEQTPSNRLRNNVSSPYFICYAAVEVRTRWMTLRQQAPRTMHDEAGQKIEAKPMPYT
jgi:hypothetical protein